MTSTAPFSQAVAELAERVRTADAIVVGAGAGLSTAAGLTYSGERFERHFSDFAERYGITDMYSGGFYPYPDPETTWAFWSRHIWVNRYDCPVGEPYADLLAALSGRDFFVLTTNVDHQFQRAGFPKDRLFYTQGDYGLWQCSVPCHARTYDNREAVRQMVARQAGMRVPAELVPRCPVCGEPMAMNLRSDGSFVEDAGWHEAARRYADFVRAHRRGRVVWLEVGVGANTPGIIKYPFWGEVEGNRQATYAQLNQGEVMAPPAVAARSVLVDADAAASIRVLREALGR